MSDTPRKPREWWISKGDSSFCSELQWNPDADMYKKNKPDGFYDIIVERFVPDSSLSGKIYHVVEHSALVAAQAEIERLNEQHITPLTNYNEVLRNELKKAKDKLEHANTLIASNPDWNAILQCDNTINTMAEMIKDLETELAERTYELSRANAECEEQARLNGMGGERELKLQAEIERLKQVERDLQHEMRMQSALLKNAKAAIDQLNEELKIHALSDWPRKAQEYFNKGLSLEAEVESLNTLLESRERATQVHKALVDERDELKFTVESYRALLKEILEYFDAPFRAEGGKEYKLATSDVFERARAALSEQGKKE